jgi:hypothetical protein
MDYIEQDCTIEHKGHKFTTGGAVVTADYLVAYPDKGGVLKDWHGKQIGTYSVISSRPAVFFGHRSWQADRYFYMRAWVDGRAYSLRGFGHGMIARGRAVKG